MDSPSASKGLQQPAQEAGFALVFVLAMLVLVLAIVLAFFSRAALNRQIASASTADTKVRLISQAAEGYILDDIQREIAAGSTTVSPTNLSVQIRRPITLTNVGVGVTNTWAPSMAPQRAGVSGITNIVKISRGGQPFFTNGPGYNATGTVRASAIPTTNASINGKFLTKDRWNLPKLMADTETNAFVAPDWIYIDRQGNTPTDFSNLSAMASPESTNTSYVIGRYACVIYDVGGLIDINVAGNRLPDADNRRRGRLNQVSIANTIPGIANFTNFVTWRSAVSSTNTNATAGSGGLFDPTRTFIDVPPGEQAFVSRQDLLAYVASTNSIATNALPFLTTFSRDLNAPSYEPNSARQKLPASPGPDSNSPDPDPNLVNTGLLSARFGVDYTLNRPGNTPITIKSGSPVMPRRFPLSKLSLFEQSSPDPASMGYYFGLTKVDGQTWRYTAATSDGRIANLSEIAALGREPNFFEVLQAVIITGSLGKSGEDTYFFENYRDRWENLQIMQIGANIIDQWDANDFPTRILFKPNNFDDFWVAGIENIPYISQIGVAGWHPADNRDIFQAWAVFDVWNPHQIATTTSPSDIDSFRIMPISGQARISIYYALNHAAVPDSNSPTVSSLISGQRPINGGTLYQELQPDIATLNAGRQFSFPRTGNYTEPTTLGVPVPTSGTDALGVLLAECSAASNPPYNSKAIPPALERTPNLQLNINRIMDILAPYTASNPSSGNDTRNRREYPAGTTFTGLNSEYWLQEGTNPIYVSGKYGVKAHNVFRVLRGNTLNPFIFELQAHKAGDPPELWYPYQRIVRNETKQFDAATSPLFNDPKSNLLTDTHHSSTNATLADEFYTWRSRGASVGMIKVDPRTSRLGFSAWSQSAADSPDTPKKDFLGYSIRSLTSPLPQTIQNDPNGAVMNSSADWCFPGGVYAVGRTVADSKIVSPTFEIFADFKSPPKGNRAQIGLYGLVANNPDVLSSTYPVRYSDPDGVIRPGDGYFGGVPTARLQFADRPILLNRPFRSVGELGYVFRDMPWKTLDFFSRRSGDLGLLDVFSISETDGDPPLTAGQINLNTRQTAALATVLQNSSKQLARVNPGVPSSELTAAQAQTLAQAIVSESSVRPFADKGDLVTRVLNAGTIDPPDPLAGDTLKTAREAAVRALAEIGTTRTWNFLIDLVAQTGRFTASSGTGSDFLVQGEERVWIHVAIDRMTGEVLELRREVVNE